VSTLVEEIPVERRITLKDIADEAGVSVMTVSNSLNGKRSRVSPATSARIEEIARARGYVANASARSLAARASKLIGLLVLTDVDASLSLSPYNVEVFSVLERELRDRGYHVLFRGVSSVAEVDVALRSWDLDGAFVLGFPDRMVEQFRAPDSTPIVALDSYARRSTAIEVRSDDLEGGRLAAEHLLAAGHRRILFAGPGFDVTGVVHERHEGFVAAFSTVGATWDPRDRAEAEATYEAGVELGGRLAHDHPDVTAVFATADVLAIGLMEGARATGCRVPEDLSVVGYDDLDVDEYVTPKLTSIDQDVPAKAADAARLMLAAIGDDTVPEEPARTAVRLIERDSVRRVSTTWLRRV
jgi:LacI family transcriptional regulator